jgi:hypothetical protein
MHPQPFHLSEATCQKTKVAGLRFRVEINLNTPDRFPRDNFYALGVVYWPVGDGDRSFPSLVFLPKNKRAPLNTIIQNSRKKRTITTKMSSPKITLDIAPPFGECA